MREFTSKRILYFTLLELQGDGKCVNDESIMFTREHVNNMNH